MRKTTRLVAVGATLPLIAAALTTAGTSAQAGDRPTAVAGGNPTWTRTTPAIGHSPARPLGLKVYLAPRGGQPALNAAVHDVSTPGNASFRHFRRRRSIALASSRPPPASGRSRTGSGQPG